MADERLTVAEYRALADIRCQLRRFLRFSEDAARGAGLEPQHHQVLLALRGMPDGTAATIGVLADRLQLRHHTMVELIDRMAARNLVRRRPGTTDRRQVVVRLTPRGERVLPRLSLAHRAELRAVAPALLRSLAALTGDRPGRAVRGR